MPEQLLLRAGAFLVRFLVGCCALAILVMGILQIASVHALSPATTGSSYRLYQNADSLAPGTPLAATNTPAQLSNTGDNFRLRTGLTTRDDSLNITIMSPNSAHGCAVASGKAYCTGVNTLGALGGGGSATNTNVLVPVDTSTGLSGKYISSIATGRLLTNPYTCAVANGAAYCWGSNEYGALGVGMSKFALPSSSSPMAVVTSGALSGKTVTAISTGDGHACAVADSAAYCWGTGGNGRIGDGTTSARTAPVAVETSGVLSGKTVLDISAASSHSCALAEGKAYCWGRDNVGQLGNNTSLTDSSDPVAVDTSGVLSGKTITSLSANNSTGCAVTTEGKAYCWGQGNNGMLGTGSGLANSAVPVAVDMTGVMAGKTLVKIAAGAAHVCAISSDGLTYCWGNSGSGALGNGVTSGTSSSTPVAVTYSSGGLLGKTAISVLSGGANSCVTTSGGEAYCWGNNGGSSSGEGQLGVGNTTANITAPTKVLTTNVTAGDGVTIPADTSYKLQYAKKTAGSCSAQTGFANVTDTSDIAWNSSNTVPSPNQTIASAPNDPASSGTTIYEQYTSNQYGGNVANAITPGNTGLWDFSLKDNSGFYNTSYCLRMAAYATPDPVPLDAYSQYVEIKTAVGTLSVDVVDGSGVPVATPSFALSPTIIKNTCQTTTGVLGTSVQQLRVTNNVATDGWNLSIAATNGATAAWSSPDTSSMYDYNDPSGSPSGCNSGSDGDGIAGLLTVDGSAGSVAYSSGCDGTGITLGASANFDQGVTDAITIMSGSSSAPLYCSYDRTNVGLSQSIPANQPAGNYVIDMTATVVAL